MPRRLAALVNRNAPGVTPNRLTVLHDIVGSGVHVTASATEARTAVRAILDAGYQALAIGGGDGTFMQVVSDLVALTSAPGELPVLMPLRLGTGNAISDVSGSSRPTARGLSHDLERARGDEPPLHLKLLDVDGIIAQFAGVGLDADYAADFRRLMKQRQLGGVVGRWSRGIPGLAVTALAATVPRLLTQPPRTLRIVAIDEPAWRMTEGGERAGAPFATGDVLYEGPFSIAAAATIHSYAHGMNFFPFSEALDGAFHLRVSAMTGREILAALPLAFDGNYRHAKLLDFAARAVAIELAAPANYHVGGDLPGPTTRFTIRLSQHTVPMLFRRPA